VIAGLAATTTREAVALARAVMERGAEGVLAILEAYFPVSEQGVEDYFRAIAAAVDGPSSCTPTRSFSAQTCRCR
jgi:4-hydroxy-tetrahydrodipicolinate synthase